MISPIKRLKKSLPARLLLIFILVSILMSLLIVGTLVGGFASQWKVGVKPHLEQYLSYVNSDIGNPPSIERAEELAEQLPINIYISGNGLEYSSTGIPLDVDDLDFRQDHRRWGRKNKPEFKFIGQDISFGEHQDRTVLRNRIGDYQVYYELPHTHKAAHRDSVVGKALFWLLIILLASYFILRRMLRPVQDIKVGVQKMGSGNLDYRIPVRGDNDLYELSASINRMAEDIEGMLDAKRQLLLGVSHELRSPLTRARIAVQMLEDSGNRDRIQEDLLEMEALITEILETERMKASHSALNRSKVDLVKLSRAVIEEISADRVQLLVKKDPFYVDVDEPRFRLLIRNLISNAIRHGGDAEQPPQITFSQEGTWITVQVSDKGPGIEPEHLEKVTEPFYRVDPSRTRSTGGFGLGLYLCKLIAEAHGGKLVITSGPNDGTRVDVMLPIDQN